MQDVASLPALPEQPARKGSKVKTKGKSPAVPVKAGVKTGVKMVLTELDQPIMAIGRKAYELLERMLVKNEAPMNWTDVEKVWNMTFSDKPRTSR